MKKFLPILAAVVGLGLSAPIAAQPATTAAENTGLQQLVGNIMPGAFFMKPSSDGPFPVIILLGGSEGNDGSARRKAPVFVAEGYAVLGVPYYSPAYGGQPQQIPGLPRAFDAIPVDALETARDWLQDRDDVKPHSIGIYGVSKGAEFALLGGSLIDGFAAIAAIVPTDVVWEGWGAGTTSGENSSFSWRGQPLPFVPYIGMNEEIAKYSIPDETPRLRLAHDKGRHAYPAKAVAARIKVENIDEPVLVAGGDADNVWNSGEMTQAIAEMRAANGLPTVSLIFTDAGHGLSGTGDDPNGWYSDTDLEAQNAIWPATLAFFAKHLKRQECAGRSNNC
ncbi:alpha/beta hydrolase family protein [Pontixanthobacter sp.]|uniref:alpha/beta hydrolase family protein n=1 Tax=Pontixanthobacter sp. TaxID=2792078 RepID=UPI003C7E65D9